MRVHDGITRFSGASFLLLGVLTAAAPLSGQASRRTGPARAVEGAPDASLAGASLQVLLGNTRIQFDVRRPLAELLSPRSTLRTLRANHSQCGYAGDDEAG
jgi:hypothetical protein